MFSFHYQGLREYASERNIMILDFEIKILQNRQINFSFEIDFKKFVSDSTIKLINVLAMGTDDFCIRGLNTATAFSILLNLLKFTAATPHFLIILGPYPFPRSFCTDDQLLRAEKINSLLFHLIRRIRFDGHLSLAARRVEFFPLTYGFFIQTPLTYEVGVTASINTIAFSHWSYSFFTKKLVKECIDTVFTYCPGDQKVELRFRKGLPCPCLATKHWSCIQDEIRNKQFQFTTPTLINYYNERSKNETEIPERREPSPELLAAELKLLQGLDWEGV